MEELLHVRSIQEIPLPFREIFSKYVYFNPVQSEVLDDILYSDGNIALCSPTGSGKTAIFELAVTRLLMQYDTPQRNFKIIYISPIRSLCHERLVDWNKKFSNFDIRCICVTGDSEDVEMQQLMHYNLIISTPEKWDSLTRRWRENELVKVVKLFMIDEVHLLNEEDRGSTLEVIVSRMKTVQTSCSLSKQENCQIRFIALSATIGNIEDIAEWIDSIKYFQFPEEMRPVPLKKLVLGFNQNSTSVFKFDLSLNYKLQSLLIQHSEGKPALIFCNTRKSVEMTAKHLFQTLKVGVDPNLTSILRVASNNISDRTVRELLMKGIGLHHAGLAVEDRHGIEEMFRAGYLPILVATSTLAMGVNLPAHLVVIKSTKYYNNGSFQDYSITALQQMMGRAGRPQYDTSATVLILTTNEDKAKIERMLSATEPVESNLHRHLTEHLNAEVVLGTITGLDVALQWLTSTFLYVRAKKNPRHYGLPLNNRKDQLDKKLLELFQIDLNKLVRAGMITMDENINVSPTMSGHLMAKYYVDFETMKMFTHITGTEIFIQILALISKCQEFSEIRLRVNDKKTLNLLNRNSKKQTIRFPLNGKIKTWDMKINCIIQAVLGNIEITDINIQTESYTILRNAQRIIKCLIEYLKMNKNYCYAALFHSIILGKCLNAKLWENSPFVSKQLTGIGNTFATQLTNAGKNTFKNILDSNPRDLELIIKRKPPFGDKLIEEVKYLPRFSLTMEKTGSYLQLVVILENADLLVYKSTVKHSSNMTLIVGNNRNETLIYEKYQISYLIQKIKLTKVISIGQPDDEYVEAHFISEDWVGIDCSCDVVLENETRVTSSPGVPKLSEINSNPNQNSYIRTFLDIYMKIKKPDKVKNDKSGNLKPKNKQPNENSKNIDQYMRTSASTSKISVDNFEESLEIPHRISATDVHLNENVNFADANAEPRIEVNRNDGQQKNVHNDDHFKDTVSLSLTQDKKSQFTTSDNFKFDTSHNTAQKPNLSVWDVCDISLFNKYNLEHTSGNAAEPNLEVCQEDAQQTPFDTDVYYQDALPSDYEVYQEYDESIPNYYEQRDSESNIEEECQIPQPDYIESVTSTHTTPIQTEPENIYDIPTEETDIIAPDYPMELKSDYNHSTNFMRYTISQKYLTDAMADEKTLVKPTMSNNRYGKHISVKNLLNCRGRKKKKLIDVHPSEDLKDQCVAVQKIKYISLNFKKPKKMSCNDKNDDFSDSTIIGGNRYKEECSIDHSDRPVDNQKNITWRSPLVFSPGIKSSPRLDFVNVPKENSYNELQSNDHDDSFRSSTTISSKASRHLQLSIQKTPKRPKHDHNNTQVITKRFLLSDKEFEESQQDFVSSTVDNVEKFADVRSTPTLKSYKTKDKNISRVLNRSHHESASDYFITTSQSNQKVKKQLGTSFMIKNEDTDSRNVIDNEPMVKNESKVDFNASFDTYRSRNNEEFLDDDTSIIPTENEYQFDTFNVSGSQSEEIVDTKPRLAYPYLYRNYETSSGNRHLRTTPPISSYVPRSTYRPVTTNIPNTIHYSNYVNSLPMFHDPAYENYRASFDEVSQPVRIPNPLVHPVSYYGNIEAQYCGNDHSDLNPQTFIPKRPIFAEEYATPATMLRGNHQNNSAPMPRFLNRVNDPHTSFVIQNPVYPVSYDNQNIYSHISDAQINNAAYSSVRPETFDYEQDYEESPMIDKEYVMEKYLKSIRDRE